MSELMMVSKCSSCPTAVMVQGQEAAWFPHKGTHQTPRPVQTHRLTHNRTNASRACTKYSEQIHTKTNRTFLLSDVTNQLI